MTGSASLLAPILLGALVSACSVTTTNPGDDGVGGSSGSGGTAGTAGGTGVGGSGPCEAPSGTVYEDDSTGLCYRVVVEELVWAGAKAECEAWNGQLAVITSALHQSAVSSVLERTVQDATFWIGLTNQSGTYVWVSGEALDYTSWEMEQPNDDGVACAGARGDSGWLWHDEPCSDRRPYVCQR